MKVKVLYLASLREQLASPAKISKSRPRCPRSRLAQLLMAVVSLADGSRKGKPARRRQQEMARDDCGDPGDEVAFFPPVTGAEMPVRIQTKDFDAGAEIAGARRDNPKVGAVGALSACAATPTTAMW